jgi:predicted transposase YbfD/YdcC
MPKKDCRPGVHIRSQGEDYLLVLKGNQGSLHDIVEDYFTAAMKNDFDAASYDYFETTDAGHG